MLELFRGVPGPKNDLRKTFFSAKLVSKIILLAEQLSQKHDFGDKHREKTYFPKVVFRPRDPSKKLGHVVRISLVQFSASELHEVSSYDRLKIEKVKIRILRRQHLLKIMVRRYGIKGDV